MTTRTQLLALTAAAVSLAAAGGAAAATYVEPWTTSPTGGISVAFGDNGLGIDGAESIAGQTSSTHVYDAGTGAFTDTFAFELPTGVVGFTLSSIGFLENSALTVTSFTFNGVVIPVSNLPVGEGGNIVLGASGPLTVNLGGPQVLTISGFGGSEAVFGSTATFSAALVPEPGAWALMIMGFGGTGAVLRKRRNLLAAAA
jgi:hypothetical protein